MPRLLVFAAALLLLSTAASSQSLSAYPNPHTGGPLTVQADAPDAAFELIDVLGRRVDVRQPLAPGAYLWRLRYADGSASTARPLTLATAGPLDVRLVHDDPALATLPTSAPRRTDLNAKGGGCAPSTGSALFGGFYHAPAPGVEIEQTANLMTVRGAEGAGFSSCLPGVSGFNIGMPPSASAFMTGSGTALLGTTFGGDVSGEPFSASFLLEEDPVARRGGGASASIQGGLDPAEPRRVEVIRYDAEGAPRVVASAMIPGGTPLSTPFGRVSSGYLIITMENVTATGWKIEEGESAAPGGTYRDDVFVAQFDFGTNDPSGLLTFDIPGATVQGHALALTAQIDGLLSLGLYSMSAAGTEFQVSGLYSASAAGTEIAPVATAIPAWMQMQDPNGLMTDASTMDIRCGQGETCASYGVQASPSFIAYGAETSTFAPESIVSAPTAASIYGGPFESAPGRGLLTDQGDAFTTRATYNIMFETAPAAPTMVQRSAVVTFGKPRLNKTTLRMEEECADELTSGGTPCESSFTRFELRYVRNGQVRVSKVLPTDRTVTFKAQLEILDATAALDASTPYVRYTVALNGGDEYIELRPVMEDPTVTGFSYQEITWTYTEPWTLGAAGWEEGVAARPAAVREARDLDEWAFEIE